jgi:nicotinamidase-related amidase
MSLLPFPIYKDVIRYTTINSTIEASNTIVEPIELLRVAKVENITFTRRASYISTLKLPGLIKYLAKKGIKSLSLAGLSTLGCVLRTAV